ncbi:hypothetical protein L873DRAFT_1208042 [Choiromyces venosus 120613-1]|uniref:Transmembrane protein n=1 Tax=Choiromyces venosus 120613-1 TaxID=1336337 RepID=A0A3N4JEK8_9PEZI|nr:hypothetical protein L873DRAFT_1208042 [Choiromyces venosus 120613-1]
MGKKAITNVNFSPTYHTRSDKVLGRIRITYSNSKNPIWLFSRALLVAVGGSVCGVEFFFFFMMVVRYGLLGVLYCLREGGRELSCVDKIESFRSCAFV